MKNNPLSSRKGWWWRRVWSVEERNRFKMVISSFCRRCLFTFHTFYTVVCLFICLGPLSAFLSSAERIAPHRSAHSANKNNHPLNTGTFTLALYVKRRVVLDNDTRCPSNCWDGLVRMAIYILHTFITGGNHLVLAPGLHNNSVKLKSLFWLLQLPILILKGCDIFYHRSASCRHFYYLCKRDGKIYWDPDWMY